MGAHNGRSHRHVAMHSSRVLGPALQALVDDPAALVPPGSALASERNGFMTSS